MTPLLSIIVPTKNRYKYLYYLIELINDFESNDIELVIQDNSDDNTEFVSYLNKVKKSWLHYFYCSDRLTSIENFDKAVLNSKGRYVCFIGDDDGVTRQIVDCVHLMEDNNIEAAKGLKTMYFWPETGKDGGLLVVEKAKRRTFKYLNPLIELKRSFSRGLENLGEIPVLYTGIVKRTILDDIFLKYKTYFPGGASADIANGVALCFYVKRFAKIYTPLVITGTSSMTGSVSNRRRLLEFSEVSFISPKVGENWEGTLPPFWSGQLVWPESAIKSLRVMGKESFILDMNVNRIMALFLTKNNLHFSDYTNYYQSSVKTLFEILRIKSVDSYRTIINALIRIVTKNKYGLGTKRYINNETIKKAEKIISSSNGMIK